MAVPTAPTPLAGSAFTLVPPLAGDPAAGPGDVIEVLGRLVRDLQTDAADVPPEEVTPEVVHSLRLLALDNLIEIVQLREALAERDAALAEREAAAASLRLDVETWQERAKTLSEARAGEKLAAHHRERELITVLHRSLTENESLQAEVTWRRRPWWRRGRRPQAAAVMPAQLLASAPR